MPKSSKKRKDKAADFAKAKLKLGKGKQAPSNAVDTSFKARSIALPSQTIAHHKNTEAPTTKRKLTFEDLTAHLKHYNASTRRDAILGLRELLEAHLELIIPNLTALINNCVRVIGDEDASVRKTLLSFLSWLLPRIPQGDLIPHAPVLLLFTTSAQTHIFPEIRIDAIRFLDLLLELVPSLVTEGWTQSGSHGRRVLEGYLGILNAGTIFGEGADTGPVQATSTASVVLSSGSRLIALKSLSSFLNHALSSSVLNSTCSASPTPTWFQLSSFSSTEAFIAFDSILRPIYQSSPSSLRQQASHNWTEELDLESHFESFHGDFDFATASIAETWALQDLIKIETLDVGQTLDSRSTKTSFAAHLAHTLHSTLVATFLDCAPAVLSPSATPLETELQMVLVVGEICRSLYGAILREPLEAEAERSVVVEDLRLILGYFAPYFPFTVGGSVAAKRDIKVEQAFQDLNLIYCELTSFLLLASPETADTHDLHTRRNKARHFNGKSVGAISAPNSPPLQVSRVSEYVVQLLRGETLSGSSSLARPITPAAYTTLLPTIWSLLSSLTHQDTSEAVLMAVVEHALRASSTSAVKQPTINFLGRLILLEREAEYRGTFRVGRNSGEDADGKLAEWVLQLPRTLWELGAGNLPTTETVLRFLLRLCQRRSPLLPDEVLASLRSRLVPYFVVTHATRGKLLGPFSRLAPASPLCRLSLDVVITLSEKSEGSDDLVAAVDEAVRGTGNEEYWTAVRRKMSRFDSQG